MALNVHKCVFIHSITCIIRSKLAPNPSQTRSGSRFRSTICPVSFSSTECVAAMRFWMGIGGRCSFQSKMFGSPVSR